MSANGNQNGSGGQNVGASVITSPASDTRTLNHRGTDVGSDHVTRTQNTAGSLTPILEWEIPKKYQELVYAGGRHWTKAELRALETFSGDGSATTFSMTADLLPIGGEPLLDDQPFPVVVAYDTAAGSQLSVADVDYVADEVTFESAPSTGTDNVKIWPVIADGIVQYRGLDAFENLVGPLDEWGVPVHVFADWDQEDNRTQIHLPGAGRFERAEYLTMYLNSDQQVVWEDADYPEGQFVSKLEQRVDVQV